MEETKRGKKEEKVSFYAAMMETKKKGLLDFEFMFGKRGSKEAIRRILCGVGRVEGMER
jgi:hypothetical protein